MVSAETWDCGIVFIMGWSPLSHGNHAIQSFKSLSPVICSECVILKTALIAIVLVPKDGLLQVDHTVLQLCPRGS